MAFLVHSAKKLPWFGLGGGGGMAPLPPPLDPPLLSYHFPSLPFRYPPLRSKALLSQLGDLGSAVSFPSGVRGGVPAENVFGVL